MSSAEAELQPTKKSFSEKMLDGIEKAGNKVPHPVIMFLYLILGVIVLSMVLSWFNISVTEDVAVPIPKAQLELIRDQLGGSIVPYDTDAGKIIELPDYTIQPQTFEIRSLLSVDGIRYIFSGFVSNFAGFSVVAVTFVAMMGVGVAEHAGLMAALIRKLVKVAPRRVIAFAIIFVGVLSSVASDAGYLILIPLAAVAFLTLGRHPLAGLAAGFAGVGAIFGVNLLITPVDSMLTEITNEAIGSGGKHLEVTANFYFGIASSIILAIVAVVVTQRIVEPRLGPYDPTIGDPVYALVGSDTSGEAEADAEAAEARGLRFSLYGLLGMVVLVLLLTLPHGAPLRDPVTGDLIGNTPFMASLIFIITLVFLVCGICYGVGAKTIQSSTDVITGVTKTFAGLSGLIFMLLIIS
ncbi:MAG: hypothetical protein RJA49_2828, partial [Actinomycetota bacterium]